MKRILFFILIISFLSLDTVFAADEIAQEDQSNEYFDIEVDIGTQSFWDKSVPITVKFTPKIDSIKTELTFDHLDGIQIVKRFDDFFAVSKDQSVSLKAKVIPESSGSFSIGVNVISWGDYNYINSEKIKLEFGDDRVLVPAQQGYKTGRAIYVVIILGFFAGLIFGVFLFLKKISPLIIKWIKPDVY
jgi:hypothetical protein